jgi:hypothetical protein
VVLRTGLQITPGTFGANPETDLGVNLRPQSQRLCLEWCGSHGGIAPRGLINVAIRVALMRPDLCGFGEIKQPLCLRREFGQTLTQHGHETYCDQNYCDQSKENVFDTGLQSEFRDPFIKLNRLRNLLRELRLPQPTRDGFDIRSGQLFFNHPATCFLERCRLGLWARR